MTCYLASRTRKASVDSLLCATVSRSASLDSRSCSLPAAINSLKAARDSLFSSMNSLKAALDSLFSSMSSLRASLDSLSCSLPSAMNSLKAALDSPFSSMSSLNAAEFSSCCFERTLFPQSITPIPLPIRRHCSPPTLATTQIFNSLSAKIAASNSVIFPRTPYGLGLMFRVLWNASTLKSYSFAAISSTWSKRIRASYSTGKSSLSASNSPKNLWVTDEPMYHRPLHPLKRVHESP